MHDTWYFAYGSNLSRERKAERTGELRQAVRCRLHGYRLAFNKRPQQGEGACASIVRDPASTVWGVAYLCDEQAIDALDGYEGVEGGHYRRETVEVVGDAGEQLTALTYVAGLDHLCDGELPRPEYLQLILDGAREHGLPEGYVVWLEALGTGALRKKVLYVDMDGVLVDFRSAYPKLPEEVLLEYEGHEDDIPGIFALMEPMEGAIDAYRELSGLFDTYILSTSPWNNPSAWSDKLLWVQRHLGDVAYKRLILSHHKDLCRGAFLIDDRAKRGAEAFGEGLVLFDSERFPDWPAVMKHMRAQATVTDSSDEG
jgi:5'-nucleotidase